MNNQQLSCTRSNGLKKFVIVMQASSGESLETGSCRVNMACQNLSNIVRIFPGEREKLTEDEAEERRWKSGRTRKYIQRRDEKGLLVFFFG